MLLETDRLRIAPLTWKDVKNIHEKNSIPEVEEFNTIGIPESLVVTRDLLAPTIEEMEREDPKKYGWTIRDGENFTFMGELGLSLSTPRFKRGEIHYSLLPQYWGKGFATEAVMALISFGFDSLGLHRIEAGVATGNTKSIQLLERVGMVQEGMHRKILPIRGQWVDNYSYAILDEDKRPY